MRLQDVAWASACRNAVSRRVLREVSSSVWRGVSRTDEKCRESRRQRRLTTVGK